MAFTWDPDEPGAWRVVLLDADLTEVFRTEPRGDGRLDPLPEPIRAALAEGGDFYWFVEDADRPQRHAAPVWIRVPAH